MHAIINAEIGVMPYAVLLDMANALQAEHAALSAVLITGTSVRESIEQAVIDALSALTESELKDRFTLLPCFIVHAANILYDADDDDGLADAPKQLGLLFYPDLDISDDEMVEFIHSVVDDKISNITGYCFLSCDLQIEKYQPYQGTVELVTPKTPA